jgi:CRISPR/Cas system CMR-associated protein Cmr1 (group 7 of RAMP superfamily)
MVSVTKEYNIKHHYKAEHAGKFHCLSGELTKREISNLKTSFISQQNILKVKCIWNELGVCASYVAVDITAKTGRSFTDQNL